MSAVTKKRETPGAGSDAALQSMLGRQPIFDREGRLKAYELLFRDAHTDSAGVVDGSRATAQVIANALTEFDLDDVVGQHKAFINFTSELLVSDIVYLLPKERTVIEVLEDVSVTPKLVAAVAKLAADGYHIALDDFEYSPAWDPLIAVAQTVKLDVLALGEKSLASHVDRLRRYDLTLLAEKVEDQAQHNTLLDMGFDLFQGFYYAKPNVVSRARIPQNHLAVVRLLGALNNPAAGIEEIEALVAEDVSLSYRLMRYMNSAFVAVPQKVESIRRAVIYFGMDMLRHWASLLVMASVDGKPKAIMESALVRARMCEGLARACDEKEPDSFFTVGLFSILDALLDAPMETIVAPLPFSSAIKDALIKGKGTQGSALSCVCAYEQCHWEGVEFRHLPRAEIGRIYLESIEWAFEATSAL